MEIIHVYTVHIRMDLNRLTLLVPYCEILKFLRRFTHDDYRIKVFTEQTGLENLYKMLSYCQDLHSCRRSLIGQHFGEEWKDEECKGMCDSCQRSEKGEGSVNF